MREAFRERNCQTVAKGGERFSERINPNGRKDFREKLVSVFIGNLNPIVDSVGLWDIFKIFGKVRDVFLSDKKEPNRSRFAFIRFETLEEAEKFAQKVNGMHVYAWPIVAKVASYDWNNRRKVNRGQNGIDIQGCGLFRGQENFRGSDFKGSIKSQYAREGRSYVEAVRGPKSVKVEVNKGLFMSWAVSGTPNSGDRRVG
ncbi:hypothetical protein Q3G72_017617 [Acer saccharum]|nr:hypothetical protein Q3G72_017617 [Acer saccharum]